jgi:hypothetical protein
MDWTRRTLVGGIASATVPLAGCSLDSPSDDPTDSGGGGDFEQVQVDGQTLVVGLGELSPSTVNVIAPDGTAFASRSVPQGATTVTFEIGLSYAPGEYRVVASTGESTIAETTLTIAPDLEILEVGVGANHLDRMPGELSFPEHQAIVKIANRGTGSEIVSQMQILGGVPNPTTDIAQEDADSSGIYDTKDDYGNLEQPVVPAQETVVFYTTTMPFAFVGDGVDCKSEPQTKEGEIRIPVVVESGVKTTSLSVHYSASEQSDECSVSVELEDS